VYEEKEEARQLYERRRGTQPKRPDSPKKMQGKYSFTKGMCRSLRDAERETFNTIIQEELADNMGAMNGTKNSRGSVQRLRHSIG